MTPAGSGRSATLIGLDTTPSSTLLDRALDLLARSPRDSMELATTVMSLPGAPPVVADRLAAALLGSDPRVQRAADGRWALVVSARPGGGGSSLLADVAFAVVDVETTGSSTTRGDRVIELGIVVVHGERRERVFDRLINPGRPVPGMITAMTRITSAAVRAAPPFSAIVDDVLAALAGRVFVAHNARFDWAFLSAELRRARGLTLTGPRLCTARLARRLVGEAESCGLDWLSRYFDLENPARHRAGGDAWATAQLLVRLLDRARADGIGTLAALQDLQAPRPRRRPKRRRAS